MHGGRIFRLIIRSFDYGAIARRQDIRSVGVVIVEARAISLMGKSIAADSSDIEREFFWKRPTMRGVQRCSDFDEPGSAQWKDVTVLRELRFDRDRARYFRRAAADIAMHADA